VAVFVINEWLWADLAEDNGRDRQLQAVGLIQSLVASTHQIVVIEGSRFDQNAWNLCKNNSSLVVKAVVAFVLNIRQNSDRCLILKPDRVGTLPDALSAAIKPDDHYLVQAQLAVIGSIVVTTDNPLRQALLNAGHLCLLRDEFFGIL
jgi:hypothetical protein